MPFIPSLAQIAPRRIYRDNQVNFLNPKPALDPLLPVNRVAHIVETFLVNKPVNPVALAEFRSVFKLVFPNAPVKVVGNADVERLGAVGPDVNAIASPVAGMHRSFASLRMTGLDCVSGGMRNQ